MTDVAQVAEGPQAPQTVADLLRAGYHAAQAERAPFDLMLSGYGEPSTELHILFRALDDYEEVRDALRGSISKRGVTDAARELELAMETLILASVGSYALIGGDKHELNLRLGLELYDHLFPDDGSARPTTDRQAVVLLFHSKTLPIMTAYTELDQWIKRGGQDSEERALGN